MTQAVYRTYRRTFYWGLNKKFKLPLQKPARELHLAPAIKQKKLNFAKLH